MRPIASIQEAEERWDEDNARCAMCASPGEEDGGGSSSRGDSKRLECVEDDDGFVGVGALCVGRVDTTEEGGGNNVREMVTCGPGIGEEEEEENLQGSGRVGFQTFSGIRPSLNPDEMLLQAVRYSKVRLASVLSHGHSFQGSHIGPPILRRCSAGCGNIIWGPPMSFTLGAIPLAARCVVCNIWVHRACISCLSIPLCPTKDDFLLFLRGKEVESPDRDLVPVPHPSIVKGHGHGKGDGGDEDVTIIGHDLVKEERKQTTDVISELDDKERLKVFYGQISSWSIFSHPITTERDKEFSSSQEKHEYSSKLTQRDNLKQVGKLSVGGGIVGIVFGGPLGALIGINVGALVAASDIAGRALWARNMVRIEQEGTRGNNPISPFIVEESCSPRYGGEEEFARVVAMSMVNAPPPSKINTLALEAAIPLDNMGATCNFDAVYKTVRELLMDSQTGIGAMKNTLLELYEERRRVDAEANQNATPRNSKDDEQKNHHVGKTALDSKNSDLQFVIPSRVNSSSKVSDMEFDDSGKNGDSVMDEIIGENLAQGVKAGVSCSTLPRSPEIEPLAQAVDDRQPQRRQGVKTSLPREDFNAIVDPGAVEGALQDAHWLLTELARALFKAYPRLLVTKDASMCAYTEMDRLVFLNIYPAVFRDICTMQRAQDESLSLRLIELRHAKGSPPEESCNQETLQALREVEEKLTSYDKLQCFLRAVEALVHSLEDEYNATADVLLTGLATHLMWCKVDSLYAELYFVESFVRDEWWLLGKEGYALTSIEAALHILITFPVESIRCLRNDTK